MYKGLSRFVNKHQDLFTNSELEARSHKFVVVAFRIGNDNQKKSRIYRHLFYPACFHGKKKSEQLFSDIQAKNKYGYIILL